MHIAFVCQFDPRRAAPLLNAADRETAATLQGRTNTPVANMLPELLRRGHQVTLIAAEPAIATPVTLSGAGFTLRLLPQRPAPFVPILDRFRTERQSLVKAIREAAPDLVHAHWTQTGHALAALESGLPALVTVHDTAAWYEWYNRGLSPLRALASLQRLAMTWSVARRARCLVAVAPNVAAHLRRVFRYRGALPVIPNPIPLDSAAQFQALRANKPHAPDAPVIADVSGWGRIKNAATLIRAFRRLRQKWPGARLLLFGNGLEEGGPAWTWTARHGSIPPGLTFCGRQQAGPLMERLAREVDLFVHPALTEAHCMALCEAASMGLPIIASRAGGNAWTLDPLPARWVHRIRDPQAWADAMDQTLADPLPPPDPDVRRAWENRFAPAVVASELETLYRRLVASGKGTP